MSTANALSGRYVIAGIGSTAFGKLGLDTVSLNAMACREALADAGICKEEVDALFLKAPTSARESLYGQKVADAMGMQPRWGGRVGPRRRCQRHLDRFRHHGHRSRAMRSGFGVLC